MSDPTENPETATSEMENPESWTAVGEANHHGRLAALYR